MAKPLDFRNVKKKYLTVTLADEANTTIMIGTPTKAIMDELVAIESSLEDLDESEVNNSEATEDLYRAIAKVMSRNKGGIKITTEFLADTLDIEDIIIFFNAYMEFIAEVTNEKN